MYNYLNKIQYTRIKRLPTICFKLKVYQFEPVHYFLNVYKYVYICTCRGDSSYRY